MLTKNIYKGAWKKKLIAATRICVWQLNFSCNIGISLAK